MVNRMKHAAGRTLSAEDTLRDQASGNLNPMLQIFSAQGARLCTSSSYGTYAEVASCVLPADAPYTILDQPAWQPAATTST